MTLDAAGLPIIGATQERVKLRIFSDGNRFGIVDQVTNRPLFGVSNLQWVVTPQGQRLVLTFAPGSYELILDNCQPNVMETREAELINIAPAGGGSEKEAKTWALKDGEKLVLKDGDEIVASLKVSLTQGRKKLTGTCGESVTDMLKE